MSQLKNKIESFNLPRETKMMIWKKIENQDKMDKIENWDKIEQNEQN